MKKDVNTPNLTFVDMMTGRFQQQSRRIQELQSAMVSLEIKDTNPVRLITEHMVRENIRIFFLRHMWRKGIPFLHRSMTIGMKTTVYLQRSSLSTISKGVRAMTEGLRRPYLIDETSMGRNIGGPWHAVGAFSVFGMQISKWCSSRALSDIKLQQSGSATVDL